MVITSKVGVFLFMRKIARFFVFCLCLYDKNFSGESLLGP